MPINDAFFNYHGNKKPKFKSKTIDLTLSQYFIGGIIWKILRWFIYLWPKSSKSTNICKQKEGKMDFLKIAKQTQDMQLNSTWSGSVYALKDVLSYVDNNKDIAISSKVIIKNYLEEQIKKYKDLQQRTEIGKTLKGIEKKLGVEIT